MKDTFDLVVIGAGNAGLAAAGKAREAGAGGWRSSSAATSAAPVPSAGASPRRCWWRRRSAGGRRAPRSMASASRPQRSTGALVALGRASSAGSRRTSERRSRRGVEARPRRGPLRGARTPWRSTGARCRPTLRRRDRVGAATARRRGRGAHDHQRRSSSRCPSGRRGRCSSAAGHLDGVRARAGAGGLAVTVLELGPRCSRPSTDPRRRPHRGGRVPGIRHVTGASTRAVRRGGRRSW